MGKKFVEKTPKDVVPTTSTMTTRRSRNISNSVALNPINGLAWHSLKETLPQNLTRWNLYRSWRIWCMSCGKSIYKMVPIPWN